MMNGLSLFVASAAIVLFWWPFGVFFFDRLAQGHQPPTPWTARFYQRTRDADGRKCFLGAFRETGRSRAWPRSLASSARIDEGSPLAPFGPLRLPSAPGAPKGRGRCPEKATAKPVVVEADRPRSPQLDPGKDLESRSRLSPPADRPCGSPEGLKPVPRPAPAG
jgi:hypothetical protein